jgi:hypothetical protein
VFIAKPAKRIVIDGREALANMVKIKALDALKVTIILFDCVLFTIVKT